ncbi:ABC transporter substrate-binding protein [Streptomyces sp. TRM66268-LWL]|uniref:ABC transporter substrate-binding protein n=1 Tax=Streptomyces polyasparticus TaxID=2767826 RepID=A0ABR7SFP8_9ACTN|nr:ABC transporter substrate-binding protein [Streptomyces polyasparticus]MBC9713560.1 ABC transporter substrate-binding protein [Streptomyces polyasparticus]
MRLRLRGLGAFAALALLAGATGCGGDDGEGGGKGEGLEKSTLTIGTMPVADTAPFEIARAKGLFAKEGLTVRTQTLSGGAESISRLKAGALDISFGNYVSFMLAHTNKALDVRIVADAFQAAPGTHAVLVADDSTVKSFADLEGKRIGVNTKRNISALLVKAAAKEEGVELDDDKAFAEVDMPNMGTALKSGSVDAVQAVEPFVTQITSSGTGRVLKDLGEAPTQEFPIAGYATTAEFAKENPKTVAAFQRALKAAQAMADDRALVEQTLPSYTKITAPVAKEISLGTYPPELSEERLRRVADLMAEFGYVQGDVDVAGLLIRGG